MLFGIITLLAIAALGLAICAMVAVGERGLYADKVPQLVPMFQRIYDHLEGTEEPPAVVARGIDTATDLVTSARAKRLQRHRRTAAQPTPSVAH